MPPTPSLPPFTAQTQPTASNDLEAQANTAQFQDNTADWAFTQGAETVVIKMEAHLIQKVEAEILRLRSQTGRSQRLQHLECSLDAWQLQWAGIIPSDHSRRPTAEQKASGANDSWGRWALLDNKAQTQALNIDEWNEWKETGEAMVKDIIKTASIVLATLVQRSLKLLKDIGFDNVLIDEGSTPSHGDALCAWPKNDKVTIIGDEKQLGTTTTTKADVNPFIRCQQHSLSRRLRDMGLPCFFLNQQMRMTAGFADMANEIFYEGKLEDGPTTPLAERKLSRDFHAFYAREYPDLQMDHADKISPIPVDVKGFCQNEPASASRVNYHFIFATIAHLQQQLSLIPGLKQDHLGVATPYAGQVRVYRRALRQASLSDVRVGTAEFWQGKEAHSMVVDFTRARNDQDLGFLTYRQRICVLVSRQQAALAIVADTGCLPDINVDIRNEAIDDAAEEEEEDNAGGEVEAEKGLSQKQNDSAGKKNKFVTAVFKWLGSRGRRVVLDHTQLSDEFVDLPEYPRSEPEEPEEDGEEGGDAWDPDAELFETGDQGNQQEQEAEDWNADSEPQDTGEKGSGEEEKSEDSNPPTEEQATGSQGSGDWVDGTAGEGGELIVVAEDDDVSSADGEEYDDYPTGGEFDES